MYIYNVTFITSDWHMSTTVVADSHDEAGEIAADFLMDSAGIDMYSFRALGIDTEYVGEAE